MNKPFLHCRRLSLIAAVMIAAQANAGDIVVVMASGANPLTKEQVANIYLGRSNHLKPVDLPESSAVRQAFYKMATGRDPNQIRAVWSRLAFTGQGTPPKELADDDAVKRAVTADLKTVGYIDKADVDATVKIVLSFN